MGIITKIRFEELGLYFIAYLGWPFALALALPFVFEELFIYGADLVAPEVKLSWMFRRWTRLFMAGLAALLIFVSL